MPYLVLLDLNFYLHQPSVFKPLIQSRDIRLPRVLLARRTLRIESLKESLCDQPAVLPFNNARLGLDVVCDGARQEQVAGTLVEVLDLPAGAIDD